MERNTSHAQRVEMIERHLAGESLAHIATDMGRSYYTIRGWWRAYRDAGWAGIVPKAPGPPQTGALSDFEPIVKYVALRLKRENPGWGLDVLLLHMTRRPSLAGKRLPRRTALYNYLKPFYPRLRPDYRGRTSRPSPAVTDVQAVHQRWQMDFKGRERIAPEGQVAPWLVCDEFSHAPLAGIIYTKRTGEPKAGLTYRDLQANLRQVFSQWGLPDQLRMDRDPLFVGSSRLEWPGTLLLWLAGLGVTPVINRPHRPTDNAHVERLGRTWNEQVASGADGLDKRGLQARTDHAWADRRQHLPSRNPHCAGRPPLVALPELARPRRPYTRQQETDLFKMRRVHQYLAQWRWQRKVDHTGCISLADYNRRVSRDLVGQIVKVHFDPHGAVFVAQTVDGTELKRFTLPILSQDYILGTGI
jgi:hypothetical protein